MDLNERDKYQIITLMNALLQIETLMGNNITYLYLLVPFPNSMY